MKNKSMLLMGRILLALVLTSFTAACATRATTPQAPDSADVPSSKPNSKHTVRPASPPVQNSTVESPSTIEPIESQQVEPALSPEPVMVETIEFEPILEPIESVRSHYWAQVDAMGTEPPGYAAYTYVLTGRTGEGSRHESRFFKLVDAIIVSTTAGATSTSPSTQAIRANSNVFLIPSEATLAQRYVTNLQFSVSEESHRFSEPGPFLVVLGSPLGKQQSDVKNMLLADLTNVHEGAFREIVKSVKTRLIDGNVSDIEILQSIKSFLLSTLFIAEDSLVFASVAHAGIRKLFKPE